MLHLLHGVVTQETQQTILYVVTQETQQIHNSNGISLVHWGKYFADGLMYCTTSFLFS